MIIPWSGAGRLSEQPGLPLPPPPQVPCIERNGLGAIKAVSAASLALCDDGSHLVSLDVCIKSMRQTGVLMVVCLLCLEGFPGVL